MVITRSASDEDVLLCSSELIRRSKELSSTKTQSVQPCLVHPVSAVYMITISCVRIQLILVILAVHRGVCRVYAEPGLEGTIAIYQSVQKDPNKA